MKSNKYPVAVALVLLTGMLSLEIRAEDWITRAARTIETAVDDPRYSTTLAHTICNLTHPTGTNPVIASVESSRGLNGNMLSVAITIYWNGVFTNANYTTVVTWKCNQSRHISATVTSDNAAVAVSTENSLRLNTYFQETFDLLFPAERR